MNELSQFGLDLAPALKLIDVQGNLHPVVGLEQAEVAIFTADMLQEVGGTGKVSILPGSEEGTSSPFLLYYRSFSGRPKRREIARVARVIAQSQVELTEEDFGDEARTISGSRAVVFPERAGSNTGATPIMVSRRVWYNRNRSTVHFPFSDEYEEYTLEMDLVIEDINNRLCEGEVSAPRG